MSEKEVLAGLSSLLKKMDAMMNKLGGSIQVSGGNRSSSNRSTSDEPNRINRNTVKETKTRLELMQELSKTDRKILTNNNRTVRNNKRYTELLLRVQNSLRSVDDGLQSQRDELDEVVTASKRNRADQERYLNLYSESIQDTSTALAKNIKKSSMLGSALLRSSSKIEEGTFEYYKMMENLYEASKPLGENILRYANAWDESTKAMKSGLSRADFADINLKIGNAAAELAESMKDLEGTGFGSIEDIMSKNESELLEMFKGAGDVGSSAGKLKTAMISAALGLEKSGLNVGAGLMFDAEGNKTENINANKLDALNKAGQTIDGQLTAEGKAAAEELIKIIRSVGDVNKKTADAQRTFNANATAANSSLGKLVLSFQDARKDNSKFMAALKTAPKALGVLTVAAGQVADTINKFAPAFNTVMDFNAAYVPLSFKDTNIQAAKMGMSFEATTKYLQENKNTMAVYGKNFGALQSEMGSTFLKFGLTMEQSASTVGPAIATAMASGIDVSNSNALNDSIENTMKNFTSLSGVLNLTTEQYASANQDLLTSRDLSASLLGLDAQHTTQMAKSIELQRNDYAIKLGSLQLAQDLMKLQAAQAREKIMERTKAGAFAMLAGQRAGLSPEESMKLYRISQKTDSRRTDEERRFLTDSMGKIKLSQEQRVANAGSDGSALMIENENEQINAHLSTLGSIGEAQVAYFARLKANGIASADAQSASAGSAAANVTVGEVGQTINQITSVLNNTFLKSILGGSASMVALSISALSAARNLMGIGGIGGGGGGGDSRRGRRGSRGGAGGGTSGGSRLGGLGGAALKGGIAGIAGGIALDYASDKLAESGHDQAAGVASMGSSALSGAGMGAMIGSVIPVLGTGVGAAVGGALGGAYGLYQNWDSVTQGLFDGGITDKLSNAAMMAIPGAALIGSVGSSLMSSPGTSVVPSVSGLGQSAAVAGGASVNSVSVLSSSDTGTKPDKNLAVVDTEAHNYLSNLLENMQKSVVLLQQIANNGNASPDDIKDRPAITAISPASAYYQGGS